MFLFLDMPTLKSRIIIIILPTDRPDTILPNARTIKNKVAFAYLYLKLIIDNNHHKENKNKHRKNILKTYF